MTQQSNEEMRSLPIWRFVVPLLFQVGLILALPSQSVYTHITGKTVILQTIPVDPYDPLRGYSQTLSYDISRLDNLQKLPGWKELIQQKSKNSNYLDSGTELYVILESPPEGSKQPPLAWKPVRVTLSRPTSLPANQIALKGKSAGSLIRYGLETYYFPESQQQEINQAISQSQRGQRRLLVVEVKVDDRGNGVPVSLWVSDRNYRF
ncbi:MAG: GDYXXLXY domain-containing protein [Chroococcus sp. CMT-3BRIN-NPC107]|jgi:uncharacterized membrane-anchored protein|nr:GDYXXLXY domain-containing protein [Chroococcus sp. CMT-3BRIN-NPC107]